MTGDAKRDNAVAVRLTASEKSALEARAAIQGTSLSSYIRAVLLDEAARPLPALAAASELLAICHALLHVTGTDELTQTELEAFVRERARMVFEILRAHGHHGIRP